LRERLAVFNDATTERPNGVWLALWCGTPGLLETVSFDTHSLSVGPDLSLPHRVRKVPGLVS
jgi:hypothetical protein